MPSVYAATAPEWWRTIRSLPRGADLAFWQPTPAKPRQIAIGERWYFKENGRPLIHGYGLFRGWEQLSLSELFRRYGIATGYASEDELVRGMRVFRDEATAATIVGNVILSDLLEYDPPKGLAELGLDDLSVRFRYIQGDDPLGSIPPVTIAAEPIGSVVGSEGPIKTHAGPTTGVVPSDWASTVAQSSASPAFLYALRFGTHDIWKVGWTVDLRKRLKMINDHVPHEIVNAKWSCIFAEPMPSKRRAFEIEQSMLKALHQYRTHGERLNCPEKTFSDAWVTMIRPVVQVPQVPPLHKA